MMTNRLRKVLAHLQQSLAAPGEDVVTDGQLLARFVAARDEAAFAALLRRHGPMVLGVCRRLLHHTQDAEDAFQATFFVLARKAGSVRKREAVGSWLYGVAYRTARDARAMRARRRASERQVEEMPHPEVEPEEVQDWRPLLDQELHRLPEKYRAPLVLCELEGKSRKEVARALRLPEGTLSSRLATARRLLAQRLARYGPALPGGSLIDRGASACVPAALFLSTTRAALLVASGQAAVAGVASAKVALLTEGVLKSMLMAKLKTMTAVLFGVAALSVGTGGVFYQARAGAPADALLAQAQEAPKDKDARRAADDALAREKELRAQLEEARRQLAEMKAALQEQRDKEEQALRLAREQQEKAREAEVAARRAADQNLYAAELEAARQAREALGKAQGAGPDPQNLALGLLADKEAELRKKFAQARQDLEVAQRKALADLYAEEGRALAELAAQRINLPQQLDKQQYKKPPPDGDKLDQILQRLERLEKRLDGLERKR